MGFFSFSKNEYKGKDMLKMLNYRVYNAHLQLANETNDYGLLIKLTKQLVFGKMSILHC